MSAVYIGVTDRGWYEHLARIPDLDEVNFWRPSGDRRFRALEPGGLFLFKLHSPDDYIVGGGIFAHWSALPVTLAWDAFGDKNGVDNVDDMLARLARYSETVRNLDPARRLGHPIGCVLLEEPFFLPPDQWIPIGPEWERNIVQGRGYAMDDAVAVRLLGELRERAAIGGLTVREEPPRFGSPVLVAPRLGQGSFRVLVTDAYSRRCAMTRERVLPVLEAAHIHSYALGGQHVVPNGLLLRSDLHTLFDGHYLGVDPDYRIKVGDRLRDEFHNGKEYYALQGRRIDLPDRPEHLPDRELLAAHVRLVA